MQYTCLWYKVQEKYWVKVKSLELRDFFNFNLNSKLYTLNSKLLTTSQDTDIQFRILLLFGQV